MLCIKTEFFTTINVLQKVTCLTPKKYNIKVKKTKIKKNIKRSKNQFYFAKEPLLLLFQLPF